MASSRWLAEGQHRVGLAKSTWRHITPSLKFLKFVKFAPLPPELRPEVPPGSKLPRPRVTCYAR